MCLVQQRACSLSFRGVSVPARGGFIGNAFALGRIKRIITAGQRESGLFKLSLFLGAQEVASPALHKAAVAGEMEEVQ